LFYTTLYGIWFWALFSSKQDVKVAKELHEYLKGKSIQFKNEWSDAGWVYRFVINSGVEIHNQLLLNFKFWSMLFNIDPIEQNSKTCKTCCHRQRWEFNSKVFQYCGVRKSNRTSNGLLKIKCKTKACNLYNEQQ
jgi:hypothetical protein